jgi:cold shock CspA family protein
MEGVIWHIYRRQEKGMIRGDDGVQLAFRKSALNGVEFPGLCSGQRVSYLIQEGWLGREAVNVRPLPADQDRRNGEVNVQSAFPRENSSG